MKKMKQAMAVLLATALMAEPLIAAGTMNKVYAAETESNVYDQMKVTDMSVSSSTARFDKDAIAIGDDGVPMNVNVTVSVPDGWAVSEISVGWYAVGDDEYYDFITEKYNVAANPANGVFTMEHNLDKYITPDTYYLSDVSVSFVNENDASLYYELYGETTEYYKVASESEPVEFAWTAYTEKDFFELDNTKYTGGADYTVKSSTGVDKNVPLISKVSVAADVFGSDEPTQINVTASDIGSGIKVIELVAMTSDDEGYEVFLFEADGAENYTDSQTFTLVNEMLDARSNGKYEIYYMYIEDYARNYMEYYADDDGKNLIGYEDRENEDGTTDEITHKLKIAKYSVCDGKHKYVNGVKRATTSEDGSHHKECKYCGVIKEGTEEKIYKIKKISLSTTSYTYNGEVKNPKVSVYDSKGNKLSSSDDYKITKPSGRKKVGEYKVKITFKGDYKGTEYKTFTIRPKKTSIKSLTAGSKQFKVKWNKQKTQTTGYQISYSTDSDFENAKTKLISNNDYSQSTIKDLKAKKKYYVKIRTYKTVKVDGKEKRIYSYWSDVKTVKTK